MGNPIIMEQQLQQKVTVRNSDVNYRLHQHVWSVFVEVCTRRVLSRCVSLASSVSCVVGVTWTVSALSDRNRPQTTCFVNALSRCCTCSCISLRSCCTWTTDISPHGSTLPRPMGPKVRGKPFSHYHIYCLFSSFNLLESQFTNYSPSERSTRDFFI